MTAFVLALALSGQDAVEMAFERMYGGDFAGAGAMLEEELKRAPGSGLAHAGRAAALLFGEFDRMHILELEFFADDELVTDRKRLKPDAGVRARLFGLTGRARELAGARLKAAPGDRDALFAVAMATGLELEYTIMVEKRYWRSYKLSKEAQGYARRLLAMTPPVYDAYLTVGSTEYVVGSLNPVFRMFARMDGIEGSKAKGMESLKTVAEKGRYYRGYARVLLALFYLREKRYGESLAVLKELERAYPANQLIRREVGRVGERAARAARN